MMSNLSMTQPLTAMDSDQQNTAKNVWQRLKRCCICASRFQFAFQFLHFCISMFFLWAGVVEFINHPPYFDAYGDAKKNIDRLPALNNDPRKTELELLRLMDLPILILLLIYQAVCIWLKYKGLSWLTTISLSFSLLCFWIVNFGNIEQFDWKYYSTRMNGLQLQVSSIALSGTVIFTVIFYTRKKLPFKFKSSLRMKNNSKIHLVWNILAIYLVLFASFMVWFIKMYASWAFFNSRQEIMRLCSTTEQVECYPCKFLNETSLRYCMEHNRHKAFTCAQNFPERKSEGSVCIFNFNLSIYGFLLTFAYIGGLCVFISTFLHISGHYTMRGLIFAYEAIIKLHYRSSDLIGKKRRSSRRLRVRNRGDTNTDPNENNGEVTEPTEVYCSDSDDDGNGLINSLIYEFP